MQTIKIQKNNITDNEDAKKKQTCCSAVLYIYLDYRESKYVHDKFWFPIIKVFVKNSAKM